MNPIDNLVKVLSSGDLRPRRIRTGPDGSGTNSKGHVHNLQITKLRLLGFKSFVEPTDLVIQPGLTGVVGPNGCGKSNLLEALRWVMGETSFKSMRASAMEDVIFSGTQHRPSRNSAEVTLFLDNSARTAPAEFNNDDTLEITRRIEKDVGSVYRVNGQDSRARDIKLLFEDAATGARSNALVRQGQIADVINAKPQARRRILEDAAGIAGLHSRRHEAELRLKAAETNLARVHDVLGQLNSQINSLKRQARQAKRYKEISREIESLEAVQLHLAWKQACDLVESCEKELGDTLTKLADATQAETTATTVQLAAAEALQPLREEEATRAAVLQRLKLEQETLEKDAKQVETRQAELAQQIESVGRDETHEKDQIKEADLISKRLSEEQETLNADASSIDERREKLKEQAALAATDLDTRETELADLLAEIADHRAKRTSMDHAGQNYKKQIADFDTQKTGIIQNLERISAGDEASAKIAEFETEIATLSDRFVELETRTGEAEKALAEHLEQEKAMRTVADAARLKEKEINTEVATLQSVFGKASEDTTPILDEVKVEPGYEKAFAVAFGDDLEASKDQSAPAHWRQMDLFDTDPELPGNAKALSSVVKAPPELSRRLAQIGVVTIEDGKKLAASMKPGQCLVTTDGAMWRWDGFVSSQDAVSPAAQRLEQRNRLDELVDQQAAAAAATQRAAAALTTATTKTGEDRKTEQDLREQWRQTQSKLSRTKDEMSKLERAQRDTAEKRAALKEALERVTASATAAENGLKTTLEDLEKLGSTQPLEAQFEKVRTTVLEHRTALAEVNGLLAGVDQEIKTRDTRLSAIKDELADWLKRTERATSQLEALAERRTRITQEQADLSERPEQIAGKLKAVLDEISKSDENRAEAADKLAKADEALRLANTTLKEAGNALTTVREDRARIEQRLENARERRSEQGKAIADRFECAPEHCLAHAELENEEDLPDLQSVERQLSKLKTDRDRLGGVNLKADDELTGMATQFDTMDSDRQDLEAAISELRTGINKLNREGRRRLLEAFEEVNAHFQSLFATLFGGGTAELQLVESDDPLESGLEIMARPPGKKPNTMSLLSGGEQALTAMSLIFAVFLTNPSPICVLDEVDAPLDDANVERLCKMLEGMSADTDTRFLVITHHPTTMSRMNRLFGVTMAEKGVSQLVSVDLATAEQYREAG